MVSSLFCNRNRAIQSFSLLLCQICVVSRTLAISPQLSRLSAVVQALSHFLLNTCGFGSDTPSLLPDTDGLSSSPCFLQQHSQGLPILLICLFSSFIDFCAIFILPFLPLKLSLLCSSFAMFWSYPLVH